MAGVPLLLALVHFFRPRVLTLWVVALLVVADVGYRVYGLSLVLSITADLPRADRTTVIAAWLSEAIKWSLPTVLALLLLVIGEVRRRRQATRLPLPS